jgi:hypothetical protein
MLAILLDSRTVFICDFTSSRLDGEPPRVRAEDGFKHPDDEENDRGTIRSELHTLGSTIYEIITSSKPHSKLQDWMAKWAQDLIDSDASDDYLDRNWMAGWIRALDNPDTCDDHIDG